MTSVRVDTQGLERKLQRIRRHLSEREILAAIGARNLNWINRNFRAQGLEQRWPPLSPNTIAARRRGSSVPLQDTGRLRQSFTDKIQGSEVHVGTQSEIAEFHHFGTRPYTITPKNARFLRFQTTEGIVFRKKVRHPGLPARPLLPTKAVAERMAVETVERLAERIDGAR